MLVSNLGDQPCRVTFDGARMGRLLLSWGTPPRVAGDGEAVELGPRSTSVLEAPTGRTS